MPVRTLFGMLLVLFSISAFAQRPRDPRIPQDQRRVIRDPSRAPGDLQRVVDMVKEWDTRKMADGARVCHFQAVLNKFIEVENAMDTMQPNVSFSKASDLVTAAGRLVPADNHPVSFQLRALMITARQIFDPHASPDIVAQRERFHREVLEPAYKLITPEVLAYVESAQQLTAALQAVSDAQSDMATTIVHAIHGDCSQSDQESHFE